MPHIRYLCLSDLHFGEEDGLLTNVLENTDTVDPINSSPVMDALGECLQALVEEFGPPDQKPTIILNGDIMELALAPAHLTGMVFQRFFEGTMATGRRLFGKVFYIPGNHDHHLWEMTRETQYTDWLDRHSHENPILPVPWHKTRLFCEGLAHPVRSHFLETLLEAAKNVEQFRIQMAYPNFCLINDEESKAVVFHHGQFAEEIYWGMSHLRRWIFPKTPEPYHVWDVEKENFAWIDFFWSVLGRSELGIETVYEKMMDPEEFKPLLKNLAENLARKFGWRWADPLKKKLIQCGLGYIYGRFSGQEKLAVKKELSDRSTATLKKYLHGPLLRQMAYELEARELEVDTLPENWSFEDLPAKVRIPETTFVFGHTHKPYSDYLSVTGFPGQKVEVYNTGGWVVDTVRPAPLHGGALVVLDERLNAASIRCYNEEIPGGKIGPVRVEEAAGESSGSRLGRELKKWLEPGQEPWASLTGEIEKNLGRRRVQLQKRIKRRHCWRP